MSKLERWLPFKFRRKNKEERNREAQGAGSQQSLTHPVHAGAPLAAWPSPLFSAPVQQLLRSFFDDPFFQDPFGRLDHMERWFGDFSPKRFAPNVEVSDEAKAIKITAELPGMSKDDVQLQIDDGLLLISGEKRSESESKDEGVFRTERYYGYFQRAIPLPEDVDGGQAEAEFKNGVLTIRIPKPDAPKARGKRIAIK